MNTRKRPNRFFAMLLSVCMFMTMLPAGSIAAFAEENPEVISENTIWNDGRILSNNVQIADGVTLTINGAITIGGAVTISGGGSIVRGSGNAYFNIGSGSLTLDGVTVDGNGISSGNSMFDVIGGMLALKNGTVQNCEKNSSRGGAIRMYGGTLTIENTVITNCSSTSYGGAVYYSSENTADTILNISGKAKFGTGEAGD